MGAKPSNNFQSDRPESGGADKEMQREKSGLLDRDHEKFASERAKHEEDAHRRESDGHAPFSMDNEPNNEPNPDSRRGE